MKNLFLIFIYIFLLFILSLNLKINKVEHFYQKESLINYPIYWINLDRSPNRKKKLMKKFDEYNIENYRIVAIDSKKLKLNNFNLKKNILNQNSKNEIACSLSHLKAIKTSYLKNDKISLICEDDVCLDLLPHWKNSLNKIINKLPKNWEIINLAPSNKSFIATAINDVNLFKKWNKNHFGAICYLINYKGMEKIVNKLKLLDKIKYNDHGKFVADEIVYKYLNSYTITKPLFTFIDEESTIHKSHDDFNNLGKKLILNYYNVKVC